MLLLCVCMWAVAASSQQPAMVLTPLGASLSVASRAWLRTAANATIRQGSFSAPKYGASPPRNGTYYSPDAGIDNRPKAALRGFYNAQYVRDFFYTFSFAPDLVPGDHVRDIGDFLRILLG